MADNKLTEWIRNSIGEIRNLSDGDTVVGHPIETSSGMTIIPVSRVTVGFAGAGVDSDEKKKTVLGFGGGAGTGMTVTPVAFLTVRPDNKTELIEVGKRETAVERISDFVDHAPDLFSQIRNLFSD